MSRISRHLTFLSCYSFLFSFSTPWSRIRHTGKSSLNPSDAIPNYNTLEPAEMKVLDQWYDFFSKVRGLSFFPS